MKKRAIRAGACWLCLLGAGLAYLALVRWLGFGFPCLFFERTGLLCPGCGVTRSLAALARLDAVGATRENPMIWLYLAYGTWYGGWGTVRYLRGERDPFYFGPPWLHFAFLGAVLIFSVLRNLW